MTIDKNASIRAVAFFGLELSEEIEALRNADLVGLDRTYGNGERVVRYDCGGTSCYFVSVAQTVAALLLHDNTRDALCLASLYNGPYRQLPLRPDQVPPSIVSELASHGFYVADRLTHAAVFAGLDFFTIHAILLMGTRNLIMTMARFLMNNYGHILTQESLILAEFFAQIDGCESVISQDELTGHEDCVDQCRAEAIHERLLDYARTR